jgi:superfamily II RNA helicase
MTQAVDVRSDPTTQPSAAEASTALEKIRKQIERTKEEVSDLEAQTSLLDEAARDMRDRFNRRNGLVALGEATQEELEAARRRPAATARIATTNRDTLTVLGERLVDFGRDELDAAERWRVAVHAEADAERPIYQRQMLDGTLQLLRGLAAEDNTERWAQYADRAVSDLNDRNGKPRVGQQYFVPIDHRLGALATFAVDLASKLGLELDTETWTIVDPAAASDHVDDADAD